MQVLCPFYGLLSWNFTRYFANSLHLYIFSENLVFPLIPYLVRIYTHAEKSILKQVKSNQIWIVIITRERTEKIFFLNVYGRYFWRFDPARICSNRTGSARPFGFCKSYTSTTMRVIIMKQKRKYERFLDLSLSNFWTDWSNLASMNSIQTAKITNLFSIN